MKLTPIQQKAAEYVGGPSIILAGAGTGKTSTMVAKIEHLLSTGVEPSSILALTFSNEAATQLRQKLEGMKGSSRATVATFHRFCLDLLQQHGDLLGLPASLRVFREEDVALLLYEHDSPKPKQHANTIIKAKDNNISRQEYEAYVEKLRKAVLALNDTEAVWQERRDAFHVALNTFHLLTKDEQKLRKATKKEQQEFCDAYDEYRKYANLVHDWRTYEQKRPEGTIDFSDMQLKTIELLAVHGVEALEQFEHVIVDEFQDTNLVQYKIIEYLAERTKNITVVGDRNQSIYAFRGAFTNNVNAFIEDFKIPPEAVFSLDTSFRSTQQILDVTYELIKHNYPETRKDDCLRLQAGTKETGEKIQVVDYENQLEEARGVANSITTLLDAGVEPGTIAVLFRSYSHSEFVQDELIRRQIPFSITSSEALFHKPYIKTILAYLYALSNLETPLPKGAESLWRLLHYHDSLSHDDSYALGTYLKDHKETTITSIIFAPPQDLQVSPAAHTIFARIADRLHRLKTERDLTNLIVSILDYTGLSRQFSRDRTRENIDAMMHLRDFHEIAKNFAENHGDSLQAFIEYVELLDELAVLPNASKTSHDGSLRLMSIHAAKGLEFDHVFSIGLYDGKFPLARGGAEPIIPYELDPQYKHLFADGDCDEKVIKAEKKQRKVEEERRLCYVAWTRSKNHLTITLGRRWKEKDMDPSQFLGEIGYMDWREIGTAETSYVCYTADREELAKPLVPLGRVEQFKAHHKQLLLEALDGKNPSTAVKEVLHYLGLSGVPLNELKQLSPATPEQEIIHDLTRASKETNTLTFDPGTVAFSYSGLKTYRDCPKKYELSTVLRMPTRSDDDPEAATSVGSFIHEVLEEALKKPIQTKDELFAILNAKISPHVDRMRCERILNIFWERNQHSLTYKRKIEQNFALVLDGIRFNGRIDRIDETPEGMEVIDYKTGKEPGPEDRAWQLALYAVAVEEITGKKPDILTLELLEEDKPRRYVLKDGVATSDARVVPIVVEETLVAMKATGKQAIDSYTKGFDPVKDDGPCMWCPYKLYCPKWG